MRYSILLLQLLIWSVQAVTKPSAVIQSETNAHKVLKNYVKINHKVSPCDNFFDYVCGADRPKSSKDQQEEQFFLSLVKAIRADKKYPKISASILSHMDALYRFQSNQTFLFKSVHKFMKSFGFLPFLKEPANNESQFLESLLRLTFLPPAIFTSEGLFSPMGIESYFYLDTNTLLLKAVSGDLFKHLPEEYRRNFDNFAEYFQESAWNVYQNLVGNYEQYPGYDNTTREFIGTVIDFVNEYINITAKSNVDSITNTSLHNLNNTKLQKAITKIFFSQMDEAVEMQNLRVLIDERLFEDLISLFIRKPKEGQYFILSMALLSLSYSIGLPTSYFADDNIDHLNLNDTSNWYISHLLDPRKSGDIFNLYAADLVIRNNFSVTSVKEILKMRSLVEKIQSSIKNSFFTTNFLKDDRNLITVINLLDSITTKIGLPDDVYQSEKFTSELEHFRGFNSEDDLIDQIIKLRISNFRLRSRSLSSEKSYFNTIFGFDTDKNSLLMSFLPFQSPSYDKYYPDSYIIGNVGTVIGHELFHRFTPPNEQASWRHEPKFNECLECYKSFYHEKMCYNLKLYNYEIGYYNSSICAGDFKDPYQENLPDVEGARVAYQALKETYGANMKIKAMPELFNFTHEQLFFVAFANKMCDKSQKSLDDNEFYYQLLSTEAHEPAQVRINAVAMQMSEFAIAFNCKATDAMVLPEQQRCYMLPTQ